MALDPTTDLRRASDPDLLDAIRSGAPLALAEAYHRAVPAAHAVARRLMSDAVDVEDVLLSVFTSLWEAAPEGVPLEAWIRRTTWAAGAERLRATGTPPASQSASGLLPDLPAPDVRFVDAAERAVADLPDAQRRALLLAHDKGVATTAQDADADRALVDALLALAGPETSSGDRQALDEDGCADLRGLGDWCLGIADPATAAAVEQAIAGRGGCAARSRAVRRGRRRIEGLPATPDMGQRILVTVLTEGSARLATSSRTGSPGTGSGAVPAAGDDAPAAPVAPTPDDAEHTAAAEADLPLSSDPDRSPWAAGAGDGGPSPAASPYDETDDPFAELDRADAGPSTDAVPGAADTADLPAMPVAVAPTAPSAPEGEADWAPLPGDTAELRLSDILAEDGEEDDDPFAALDRADEPAGPDVGADPSPASGSSPYAALEGLGDTGTAEAATPFGVAAHPRASTEAFPVQPADPDADVYVEGDPDPVLDPEGRARGRSGVAAMLAWLLPIIGGLAVGLLLAVAVFGPPSGT